MIDISHQNVQQNISTFSLFFIFEPKLVNHQISFVKGTNLRIVLLPTREFFAVYLKREHLSIQLQLSIAVSTKRNTK